jgi:hypothetical protein
MIRYYSTRNQVKNACRLCLEKHIHYAHGTMQIWYRDTIQDRQYGSIIKSMAIKFINNQPVGVFATLVEAHTIGWGENAHNCGTYVLREHRHKGIGRELVNKIQEKRQVLLPWKGSFEARSFYNKVLC